ncbi:hypothetical protein U1Q18_030944 [Sarracenia purpurea var. burkii]
MGCSQRSCRVEVMLEGTADTWGSEAPLIRLSCSAGMAMEIDWALRPNGAARPSTLTRLLSARLYGFDFFTPPFGDRVRTLDLPPVVGLLCFLMRVFWAVGVGHS